MESRLTVDQIRDLVRKGFMIGPDTAQALLDEIECLKADLQSESRWANQYHEDAEKLQTELAKINPSVEACHRIADKTRIADLTAERDQLRKQRDSLLKAGKAVLENCKQYSSLVPEDLLAKLDAAIDNAEAI